MPNTFALSFILLSSFCHDFTDLFITAWSSANLMEHNCSPFTDSHKIFLVASSIIVSEYALNKLADNKQPCLIPFLIGTGSVILSLSDIIAFGFSHKFLISLIIEFPHFQLFQNWGKFVLWYPIKSFFIIKKQLKRGVVWSIIISTWNTNANCIPVPLFCRIQSDFRLTKNLYCLQISSWLFWQYFGITGLFCDIDCSPMHLVFCFFNWYDHKWGVVLIIILLTMLNSKSLNFVFVAVISFVDILSFQGPILSVIECWAVWNSSLVIVSVWPHCWSYF